TTEDSKPKGPTQRIYDWLHLIRGIVTDAILILVSAGGIALIAYGLSTKVIILDQIEVPKPLETKGISSSFVSRRLADQVQRIQAQSSEKTSQRKLLQPSWWQEDIQVPGGNLYVRSLLHFFKTELGSPDTHIEGALFQPTDKTIRLVLRISNMEQLFLSDQYSIDDFDNLIKKGGEELVRMIDPCTLAAYWFGLESKQNLYPNTLKLIKHSLVHSYDASASRAYNLWGNVLNNQGKRTEAIEKYMQSTLQKAPFAEAYANWADALADNGDLYESIKKYNAALAMDPKFTPARIGLAYVLTRTGEYRASISHAVR